MTTAQEEAVASRTRFLHLWILWSALYMGLAIFGPNGLIPSGIWPVGTQHILQARAWLGSDIVLKDENGVLITHIPVAPRLDVTPYFRNRVVRDPREEGLISNLAVALRLRDGRLAPVQDAWNGPADALLDQDLVCFVGFPPGPAFLLLPFVALLGDLVASQWLSALLGGLAVAVMDRLVGAWSRFFNHEQSKLPPNLLALLIGGGTLWLWLVPDGGLFLFSQTVGSTALALSLLLVWNRRPLLSGIALGLAITSRPSMIGILPLLLIITISYRHRRSKSSKVLSYFGDMAALAAGPALIGGAALVLNAKRFVSPLDFGYRFMLLPPFLRERLAEHGQLSWSYLTQNLQSVMFDLPMVVRDQAGDWVFPWLASDPNGMSLLFVTPAFLALAAAVWATGHHQRLILAGTWLCLALTCLPGLLYYNTGWVQWGGRFLMDGWPMWILLTVLGLHRIPVRAAKVLIVLSVACSGWAALLTVLQIWPKCCS